MPKSEPRLASPLEWAVGRFSAPPHAAWGLIEGTPTEEETQRYLRYFNEYLQQFVTTRDEWPIDALHIHAALNRPAGNTDMQVAPHFLDIPTLAGRGSRPEGFRMAYTTFSPNTTNRGKRRPLVILHGYAEYGPVNFETLARQAADHLVYAVHWPGHGASDAIRDIPFYAETPSDYTGACLEFLKHLQSKHPEGVDILAHSMGGAILTEALGTPRGQSFQTLIRRLILVAPMFALKGKGRLSEILYANRLTRRLLAFIAKNSRKPKPFDFPLADLTLNEDERTRILQRRQSNVSDHLVNSESDWILAANAIMTSIARQTSQQWRYFGGNAIIWASPHDTITDGPRSVAVFRNLFPKGTVREISVPHRIHTHPEVLHEILDFLRSE